MAKIYKKSLEQCEKERSRRRKLREIVLNAGDFKISQTELAEKLGCSQATVSRDLKKLSRSRWNPYDQRDRENRKTIMNKRFMARLLADQWVSSLSKAEAFEKALQLMRCQNKEQREKLVRRWLKNSLEIEDEKSDA